MSSSSTAVRVFRGCRALLAPAKSSTPAAVKTTAAARAASKPNPKAKPKAKPKADGDAIKPKRNVTALTGILKPTPISPALGGFIGAPEASRAEAVKQIWAHIKLHNLQNPENKREIQCDEKLKELFEGKETVNFLEIGKLLSRHFVKAV